jgi:hypothetical protein
VAKLLVTLRLNTNNGAKLLVALHLNTNNGAKNHSSDKLLQSCWLNEETTVDNLGFIFFTEANRYI